MEEKTHPGAKEMAQRNNGKTDIITIPEACDRYGLAKSYMYKLTSQRKVPHYKPWGKLIYFEVEELESFLLSNRISTMDEIEQESHKLMNELKKGGRL